ncbi:adenylate/guanylate cyclase domain-containing protein [Novosphingobium sp. JCM 18896]|uniref:adenylate/guanylate cyclase domain-containing protein n=1 Tax=Novosphingobium sp. JCM 18896 TaxID=2989731 RepID=UPI002223297F|nr:adenylate/guanylate cyclase domain-containing protein [Novosphingobium sp. JCM 18896]MCW1430097.1 adenylate/guanylate cyclase domain-containing protein [Novosphingobium sp. JCM 18896]
MQPMHKGRFADPAVEARFQEAGRRYRVPFVRGYGVLFMVIALAYTVVNPLLLDHAANAQVAVWLGLTVLVAGGYVGATFWQGYVRQPVIDFAALLVILLLVAQVNQTLYEFLARSDANLHAVTTINRLAVTAFAAVALAGRPRLFLIWLGCDFLEWMGQTVYDGTFTAELIYALLSFVSGRAVTFAINLAITASSRWAYALADAFETERNRNEALVHNMLPPAAVERIRDGRMVADAYADVSVIFIDMVGFSKLAKRVSPGHLVELLNGFFNHADRCAAEHGVEKVKTIGDAYLAIAGGNVSCGNSADAAIAFARAVLEGVDDLVRAAGVEVGLRVGIHSGPVVGGVIGATRMAYDYWGETMNIAARIESTAPVNGIAISESTWLRARERAAFGAPHVEMLKGVGETCVYHAGPAAPPPVELGAAA